MNNSITLIHSQKFTDFRDPQCTKRLNHNQVSLRVPTHTGKPGKMREVFPVRGKSGNFKILPKSQGILYQSGKSQGTLDQKIKKIFYEKSLKSVVSRHIFIED